MGESKRLTPEARAARAASAHSDAVEASRDRMRKAVDGLTRAVRWRMRDMTPDEMAVALGTTVGVFAASAGGPVRSGGHRVPRRRGGPGGHRAGRGGRVMWTWWDELKTMAALALLGLCLAVSIGGFVTLLAPHEPACPPPAHVTGSTP